MDGPVALTFGLPTSVGELPFYDLETAVDFTLATQRTFPTVPRARLARCSLIHQVASLVPGATVTEPGLLDFGDIDPAGAEITIDSSSLSALNGPFEGVSRFLSRLRSESLANSEDFVGCRVGVLGPVTTALALRSAGLPLDRALELGTELASATSVALVDHLRRAVGNKTVALVLSEPGLIGSMHPTFPLFPGQARDALITVIDRIDSRRHDGPLMIGAHVPGRTDWSTIISSGFSLISAPVGGNLANSSEHLQAFLDAGGTVAWGAVPVDEPLGATEEILWRRLGAFWCSLVGAGVDPFQLRAQSMVSTADGLSHFGESQTANAYDLVDLLSTRVRRQAAGTRLSLGA